MWAKRLTHSSLLLYESRLLVGVELELELDLDRGPGARRPRTRRWPGRSGLRQQVQCSAGNAISEVKSNMSPCILGHV